MNTNSRTLGARAGRAWQRLLTWLNSKEWNDWLETLAALRRARGSAASRAAWTAARTAAGSGRWLNAPCLRALVLPGWPPGRRFGGVVTGRDSLHATLHPAGGAERLGAKGKGHDARRDGAW